MFIGVSNFTTKKLQKILQTCTIKPAANQMEVHPYVKSTIHPRCSTNLLKLCSYLLETDLINFCNENGVHVTAFSPLGGRPVAAVAVNADVPGPLHHEVVRPE